jgi:hypothetical protein
MPQPLSLSNTIQSGVTANTAIDQAVTTNVSLVGRLATAQAQADAIGVNSFADTLTHTLVDDTGASAFSQSISAAA